MKNIPLLLIGALFASQSVALPELKGTPQDLRGLLYPSDNVVTISGHAEETAYSDRATVSLVVTTDEKLLADAIASNTALRGKLRDALNAAGIADDDIRNSKFSSSPQYGWLGKSPNSYKVINRVAISIDKEPQLEAIARLADQNEEVELSDTSFEHSREDEYNQKVKSDALQEVMEQKAFYEQSLGVKLSPIGIRSSRVEQEATRGAMVLEEVVVTAARSDRDDYTSAADYRTQTPSFDEINYEAEISVDFKIQ